MIPGSYRWQVSKLACLALGNTGHVCHNLMTMDLIRNQVSEASYRSCNNLFHSVQNKTNTPPPTNKQTHTRKNNNKTELYHTHTALLCFITVSSGRQFVGSPTSLPPHWFQTRYMTARGSTDMSISTADPPGGETCTQEGGYAYVT